MEQRTKNTYGVQIYEFVKDILVVCPKCEGQAVVHSGDFHTLKFAHTDVKVVCSHCGFNKLMERVSPRKDDKQKRGNVLVFGAPIDPFFHLRVWLCTEFEGEQLWAYNLEHLDFLAQHVGAKLRERNVLKFNVKSIGARLPRWMTSAHNREAVLKAIEKLKSK